jgi:lipopolysaccharide heptosyltransferase II
MMDRILVVLPNWFGEALFATPFLHALHTMQPHSAVSVLGVDRSLEMLRHHPGLADRISLDGGAWATLRRLRRERYAAAFILRRSLSRTALLALGGVPRRIGFANAKSGWLLTDRVPAPAHPVHKAHAYLALLSVLGSVPAPGPYGYAPSPEERAWANAMARQQGLEGSRRLVVLHPGANWAHKRWPAEQFGLLAERLIRGGASVVVSEGPGDQALTQAILAKAAQPPAVLSGASIRQLAAFLELASLVVSNDTGVLHLACALNRPVVALYGPTSPALTGPLGDPRRTIVLHHPGCCPEVPCYRPGHPGFPGMDAISVDEVYAVSHKLLSSEFGIRSSE